ncbi:MAG: anthranilate synthase component II [Fibrobacterota bacterium]
MIIIVDNFDSFTYNIYQYLMEMGFETSVLRNNEPLDKIKSFSPDGIIISPGPGRPSESGVSLEVIKSLGGEYPILGVCLGHQAIGEVFGGRIVRAPSICHGKTDNINHDKKGVFAGINSPLTVTRYHSLIVERESFPKDELIVTAETNDGIIMGLRHKTLPVEGVQFHPESVASESGHELLRNFAEASIGK